MAAHLENEVEKCRVAVDRHRRLQSVGGATDATVNISLQPAPVPPQPLREPGLSRLLRSRLAAVPDVLQCIALLSRHAARRLTAAHPSLCVSGWHAAVEEVFFALDGAGRGHVTFQEMLFLSRAAAHPGAGAGAGADDDDDESPFAPRPVPLARRPAIATAAASLRTAAADAWHARPDDGATASLRRRVAEAAGAAAALGVGELDDLAVSAAASVPPLGSAPPSERAKGTLTLTAFRRCCAARCASATALASLAVRVRAVARYGWVVADALLDFDADPAADGAVTDAAAQRALQPPAAAAAAGGARASAAWDRVSALQCAERGCPRLWDVAAMCATRPRPRAGRSPSAPVSARRGRLRAFLEDRGPAVLVAEAEVASGGGEERDTSESEWASAAWGDRVAMALMRDWLRERGRRRGGGDGDCGTLAALKPEQAPAEVVRHPDYARIRLAVRLFERAAEAGLHGDRR